jgi:hypothetical protein
MDEEAGENEFLRNREDHTKHDREVNFSLITHTLLSALPEKMKKKKNNQIMPINRVCVSF